MNKEKELEIIKKAVIMACNPECTTYEKALEREQEDLPLCPFPQHSMQCRDFHQRFDNEIFKELGLAKPVTLSRVLIALKEKGRYSYSENGWILEHFPRNETYCQGTKPLCKWDLTKDLVDDQDPKIISTISKSLTKN